MEKRSKKSDEEARGVKMVKTKIRRPTCSVCMPKEKRMRKKFHWIKVVQAAVLSYLFNKEKRS